MANAPLHARRAPLAAILPAAILPLNRTPPKPPSPNPPTPPVFGASYCHPCPLELDVPACGNEEGAPVSLAGAAAPPIELRVASAR